MKAVQTLLGDHQDSVVAREALRPGGPGHVAGESAFTWGLLYGRRAAAAAEREASCRRCGRRRRHPDCSGALRG